VPASVLYRLYRFCVCLVIFIAALQKKTQFLMDLFYFDKSYAVLACLRCRYAIVPGTIASHLRAHHKDEVTKEQIRCCAKYYAVKPIQSAAVVQKLVVPRQTPPIHYLALYTDAIACRLCPDNQPHICRSEKSMRDHLKVIHQWQSGSKGGRPKQSTSSAARELWTKVTMAPICCQTFHRSNFFLFFRSRLQWQRPNCRQYLPY
jgi:hypothetical protein